MRGKFPASRSTIGRKQTSTIAWWALIVFVAVVEGCGGGSTNPHAKLTGTVTVDGKPIKAGKVIFFSATSGRDGRGAAEIVDGKYVLPKVPLGSVAFTFSASAETGKTVPGPGGAPEPERVNIIPAKISSEGITRDITGDGVQNFAIEK